MTKTDKFILVMGILILALALSLAAYAGSIYQEGSPLQILFTSAIAVFIAFVGVLFVAVAVASSSRGYPDSEENLEDYKNMVVKIVSYTRKDNNCFLAFLEMPDGRERLYLLKDKPEAAALKIEMEDGKLKLAPFQPGEIVKSNVT